MSTRENIRLIARAPLHTALVMFYSQCIFKTISFRMAETTKKWNSGNSDCKIINP